MGTGSCPSARDKAKKEERHVDSYRLPKSHLSSLWLILIVACLLRGHEHCVVCAFSESRNLNYHDYCT